MSQFKSIDPQELQGNFFKRIGEDWMLVTAEKEGQVNMMTASWGGIGIYYGRPVTYTFVRPDRHTKAFIDTAQGFSLGFFSADYRPQLTFCGTKSGRDFDKVQECDFTVLYEDGIPYFAQSETSLFCRPLLAQVIDPGAFTRPEIAPAIYPDKDYHTLYISEIIKVLVQE